jgi:hypothetical protein
LALAGNDPSRKKSMTARADGSIGFRRPALAGRPNTIAVSQNFCFHHRLS